MDFLNFLNVTAIAAAGMATFAALVTLGIRRVKIGRFDLELDRVRAEEQRVLKEIPGPRGAALTPGEHQYALLREYHAQGLAQSKISFWFSLVFSAIGFSVIIFAIGLFLRQDTFTNEPLVSTLQKPTYTLIAGTIIEAVAALFFVQSNRARQLMTEFFDRLRIDRKVDEALRLAAEIEDIATSSSLKAMLALSFADVQSANDALCRILNQSPATKSRAEVAGTSALPRSKADQTGTHRGSKPPHRGER
jgi:hypothetical protein